MASRCQSGRGAGLGGAGVQMGAGGGVGAVDVLMGAGAVFARAYCADKIARREKKIVKNL